MQVIHKFHSIYEFRSGTKPVATVQDGETFLVETKDALDDQIQTAEQKIESINFDSVNPATGPIYVQGAEPGDTLEVSILDIEMNSQGVSALIPGTGVLSDMLKESHVEIIPVKENHALFHGIKVPLHPMIGVIGVAPKAGDELNTGTPSYHGGNMDTKDITIGSKLYFPVFEKGAGFALGDLHAAMGAGEVCVTGLEIAGKVTVKVRLIKGKSFDWPMVKTKDALSILVSKDTMEESVYEATKQSVELLSQGLSLSWEKAYILASLAMDLSISQVVDPKITIGAKIPLSLVCIEDLFQ